MAPGPGFYDVKQYHFNDDKKAVSSSMFKSDSLRELMQLPRGPGPAFYKQTGANDKKILTTNPHKNWF